MRFNIQLGALVIGAGAVIAASVPAAADGMPAQRPSAQPAAQPMPPAVESPRGSCYVRGDVGYGWSMNDADATVTPELRVTATGPVSPSSFEDSWFGEVGLGCSLVRQSMVGGGSIKDQPQMVSTPTGLRAEVMYGFYGNRKFTGIPVTPPTVIDPVHADVHTRTLMFNVFYDLPQVRGFTPYVGAGLGMAFVDLRGVNFVKEAPTAFVVPLGDVSRTNLAWSLMAGVATDLGRGVMLDVGYRYINMGDIGVNDQAAGYAFHLKDLSQHQIKAGIRIPLNLGG